MPTDGRTQTHGFLDQLSTEQLLTLVRADFDSAEQGDDALINCILEVIEKREKEEPTGLLSDVDQAWEDFQAYYNTPGSEDCPLDPMRDSETAARKPAKRCRHSRLLKRLISAAAAAAVSLSCMVAAQAVGFDVFGALARWTEETFHFVSSTPAGAGSPESEAIRQTIQEVFDDYGVTVPAPAWYPEGTEFARDIEIDERTEISAITCSFICDGETFFIEAQQFHKTDRVLGYTLEKDTSDIEEYHSNGRLFYIMSNLTYCRAVYSRAQTVITIEGYLSSETLKQIIDSIGA